MNKLDLSNFKRIAISGIHGWGKTTLAKRIASLTGLPYLPEVARELLSFTKGFDWRNCDDYKLIANFEKAIYYSHLFLAKANQSFISDRTLVDVLVYTSYHLLKRRNRALESFREEILKELQNFGVFYDAVLYVSPLDGYKTTFNDVDKEIVELFKKNEELFFKVTRSLFIIKKGMTLEFSEGQLLI